MKRTLKLFVLLYVIGFAYMTYQTFINHTCVDNTHVHCDGFCECDGMECNK